MKFFFKLWLLLIVFLLAAAPANAAIALVNNSSAVNAAGGTSVAVTAGTLTAGNLLVVGVGWCGDVSCGTDAGTVTSVTLSSGGGACVQATNALGSSGTGQRSDIWYCANLAGGVTTVTVNLSGTLFYAFAAVSQWSGVATSTPLDNIGNNGGASTGTSLTVATTGNTAVSGELIIGVATTASNAVPGHNAINTVIGWGQPDDYQIAGASGSYNVSWTFLNGKNAGSLAVFKPPSVATENKAGSLNLIGVGR